MYGGAGCKKKHLAQAAEDPETINSVFADLDGYLSLVVLVGNLPLAEVAFRQRFAKPPKAARQRILPAAEKKKPPGQV